MFVELWRYITGADRLGTNKAQMNSPITMKMTGNKNEFEKQMCFYLDDAHSKPKPNVKDVSIVNGPWRKVYARFVL